MDSIFSQKLFETADRAVGEDMEYAPEFAEFMTLAEPRAERQVGDHIIAAQPPEWGDVFKAGSALLEKSHDLRILAKVCRAALQKYGLPGLAQGLALMARWIESEWDFLYPLLNVDGDYDPLFRSNAVSEIASREGLVTALRQAVFLETPIGAITISTAEQLLDGKPREEAATVSSIEQLSRIVTEEKDRNQERFEAIASISSALEVIASTFRERLSSEYWPNLEQLTNIVTRIERFLASLLQDAPVSGEANAATATTAPASPETAPVSAAALPTALNTRAEACKALALARQYFEKHEPSHPAPLLVQRVERLANLDFAAIIKDLIPEGLQQLRILAGESESAP
jgi:type VI secretion system protein ImpA